MTEEQYNAYTGAIDQLGNKWLARMRAKPFSYELSREERRAIDTLGREERAIIERELARYKPATQDMRKRLVLKAVACLVLAIPDIARAYRVGYDNGRFT